MTTSQALTILVVVALATASTRFLPFFLFSRKSEGPYISYLGKVLPYAAIGILVVYCLKEVNLNASPYGIPEGISILIIAALHLWKENTLLSIGAGTVVYMVLVQHIFI
ncbi:MAG TPA: branched-chain amino acid transporter AzlD [Clostridiales bacterium]|nr:branched-chain amino acid transporter AzlD [Clostridiales bacterium]